MQRLAHKIRLEPTQIQEQYFRQATGIARFTWNWALAEWQRQYAEGQRPSGFSLKKQFNAIKKELFPWTFDVTKYACQQPFIHLQNAFGRFFKKKARYPQFKKKGIHESFYIGNDHIQVEGGKIKLPKLGWVKMSENLRLSGRIVSATISRVAKFWFVSLQVDCTQSLPPCESQTTVGVDLGIQRLATLYDGSVKFVAGKNPLKNLLKKLQRKQRSLSAKVKGSKNGEKARVELALLHYRIRCIRQEKLHQLTTQLTKNYRNIVIEDLNVSGLLKNHKLARALSDASFYEFRRQLTYKAELRGNHLHVVDRWFPSSKRCSVCHTINETLTLKDRSFHCHNCNFDVDRDVNAAINLFSTASSAGF